VRDRIRVPLAVAPPGRRLNLVIPALDAASTFGGIRTALDLLEALGPAAPRQRIISRRPLAPDVAASFPGLSQLLLGSGLPIAGILEVGSEQLF